MSVSPASDSHRAGPTIDYRGNGAQTAHLGEGDQNINASQGVQNIVAAEGQLVQNFYQPAALQEDRDDIVAWLSRNSDTEGHLSYLSNQKTHQLLLDRKAPGTGDWLLANETFSTWRSGPGSVLWLDGIIGSGKSVLASMVVNYLGKAEQTCDGQGRSICLYVYFQDEYESMPTLKSLFATIFEQLVRQLDKKEDISGPLRKFLQQSQSHEIPQTTEEYLHVLEEESQVFPKVYLVVDGLDTHFDPQDPQFQYLFVRAARRLTKWNLLLTSRVGTFTDERLDADFKLSIAADTTAKDIELYIDMRIKESNRMSRLIAEGVDKDPHFKNHILDTIVKKAQGMFLLAKMHIDNLESQWLLGDFKKMLSNLPESIETTFEEALQRIRRKQSQYLDMALHTIAWVAASLQPITIEEVRDAFAIQKHAGRSYTEYRPPEQDLISSCAGIVVVDSQTGLLRSAHEAVMRYVQESGFLPESPHLLIARQCLAFLSLEDFTNTSSSEDISKWIQSYPLLEYAAKHWFTHFHKAGRGGDLEKDALRFLSHGACLSLATRIRLPSMPNGASGLHACASLGEMDLAKKLLINGVSVRSKTEDRQRPLHWAVQFGHLGIAQLFLDHKAPVNARDSRGNTALHIAVIRGGPAGEEMVRLLVRAEAKMDIWNDQGFTPLRWCVKYGLRDKAIPLIERQAEVDLEDRDGHTPLRLAMLQGQLELVMLMIQNGCNVNKQGSQDRSSILHHAAQYGYEPLTAFLLENKANVELRDKDGLTPLRWAITHSKLSVAKFLLDSGADVNATSNDKSTPLIQATIQATTQTQTPKSGSEQAVWLLLCHKPKMDEQDGAGNTALHYAARYGHKSILWLLVEEGASLDIQNDNGRTPLHEVVDIGNQQMAWYLIMKGANMGIADAQGREMMHLAARQGHGTILDLLLQHGAKSNQQDSRGLTPLHYIAIEGRKDFAPYLIQKGANPNAVDHSQKTALHHAASFGHKSIVQELLGCGAQPALQDSDGLTALHHAVRNATSDEHRVMITELAEKCSCLDQQDNNGQTAMMYAASRGDEVLIFILHSNGANKAIRDVSNRTAKDHAANRNHTGVMHFL